MFSYSQSLSYFSKSNVAIWLSLAFQAGTINAGGFLACHSFVTHVTGFSTMIGTEAASGRTLRALGFVSVPGFFILGTMISAFFVDRRLQTQRRPLYPIVFFLIFFLMLAVTVAGVFEIFGPFGHPVSMSKHYILLASLCLAAGLQNATVTSAFGAIVRTSHLTGITTDLGIGLMRVLSGSHKIQTRTNEVRANWFRIGLIVMFTLGSFVSAYAYLHAQYWGFLIPTGIATILFVWSLVRFNSVIRGH